MIRSIVKAALPHRAVQLLRDLGRLESGARVTYLRLAWRRRLGLRRPIPIATQRTMTLVTICHGNILRSAYAEALLRQAVEAGRLPARHRISSAGVHAWPGKSADARGVRAARELGTDLTRHRARLLDHATVESADLLLVMDRLNEAELLSRHPGAAHKVVLLGEFDPARPGDPVIADPYMGDLEEVRRSYMRVASAVDGLVRTLSRE
jgi:protein-tyrosine-phosphatase